jgi:chromosome segregation ATPase
VKTAEYKKLEEIAGQFEKDKDNLIQKFNQTDLELSEARNKLKQLEKENKNLMRENNGLMNDKDRMAREKMEALNEKNITKAGVNALTREIEYLRK